jgi:hypothetical protein
VHDQLRSAPAPGRVGEGPMTVSIVVVATGLWLALLVFVLALCHAAAAGDRLVEMTCSDVWERTLVGNRAAVARVAQEQRETHPCRATPETPLRSAHNGPSKERSLTMSTRGHAVRHAVRPARRVRARHRQR